MEDIYPLLFATVDNSPQVPFPLTKTSLLTLRMLQVFACVYVVLFALPELSLYLFPFSSK